MKNRYCRVMAQIACVIMIILALCMGTASAEESSSDFLGKPFPDFTVTDTDGNTFTLSEALKDHEAVLINFWATWCGPCKKEFPFLNEAYEKYRDRVAFIALSADPAKDSLEDIAEYRRENGLAFPMGRDEDKEKYHYVGAKSLPSTVIVDRFGNAAFFHQGIFKDAQAVERVLDRFLGGSYTKTAVLNGIPRDVSTRAFPVAAARNIYPENVKYRKIIFHVADLKNPVIGYIVPEESVRVRIEIAADDDVDNMVYADKLEFTEVVKLLDPQRNAFVSEVKIPDAAAETPYVDLAVLNEASSDLYDQFMAILFRDESSIPAVVDYLKSWEKGEVTWEFAEADEKANGPQAYLVHVVDQDNNPVEGVAVNFCTDAACVPKESDEKGLVTFDGPPAVYHVQIIDVPEGYSWDESYEMYTSDTYGEWVLSIRKD